jgi:hypothetical protein
VFSEQQLGWLEVTVEKGPEQIFCQGVWQAEGEPHECKRTAQCQVARPLQELP